MKSSRLIFFIPFLLILILLSIFIFDINQKLKSNRTDFKLNSVLIGKQVPEMNLVGINGFDKLETNDLYSSEYKLVNFWASWCAPCRAEHPLFLKLSKAGFEIFGINYKDKQSNAIKFLNNLGNPYKKLGADEDGRVAIDWGLYGVPETFIVNSEGKIIYRHAGPVTQRVFETEILTLISK